MGHYMTKEEARIICRNCVYWRRIKNGTGDMGTCINSSQKRRHVFYFNSCIHFWPNHRYSKSINGTFVKLEDLENGV